MVNEVLLFGSWRMAGKWNLEYENESSCEDDWRYDTAGSSCCNEKGHNQHKTTNNDNQNKRADHIKDESKSRQRSANAG